jgi:hypothetical protein
MEYDSFSKYRIVNEEIERLTVHYFDNFFNYNKDAPAKRQQKKEVDLIEAFWYRYDFGLVQQKNAGITPEDTEDGLPLPRVLYGTNTNKDFKEASDAETRLYKINHE